MSGYNSLMGNCHGGLKTRKIRRKCLSAKWWHRGKYLKEISSKLEFKKIAGLVQR